jgi:hypothetical protein
MPRHWFALSLLSAFLWFAASGCGSARAKPQVQPGQNIPQFKMMMPPAKPEQTTRKSGVRHVGVVVSARGAPRIGSRVH